MGILTTANLKPERRGQLEELADSWNCSMTAVIELAIDLAWHIRCARTHSLRKMDAGEVSVSRWCRECLVTAPGNRIRAGQMHSAYVVWCSANGREPVSLTCFGKLIARQDVKKETVRCRVFYLDVKMFGRAKAISRPAQIGMEKEAA